MMTKPMIKIATAASLACVTALMTHFAFQMGGFPSHAWPQLFASKFKLASGSAHAMYLLASVLVTYVYAARFHNRLPGPAWKAGSIYGALLWLAAALLAAPFFGLGFFMGSALAAITMFASFALYGAVMAYVFDA